MGQSGRKPAVRAENNGIWAAGRRVRRFEKHKRQHQRNAIFWKAGKRTGKRSQKNFDGGQCRIEGKGL